MDGKIKILTKKVKLNMHNKYLAHVAPQSATILNSSLNYRVLLQNKISFLKNDEEANSIGSTWQWLTFLVGWCCIGFSTAFFGWLFPLLLYKATKLFFFWWCQGWMVTFIALWHLEDYSPWSALERKVSSSGNFPGTQKREKQE